MLICRVSFLVTRTSLKGTRRYDSHVFMHVVHTRTHTYVRNCMLSAHLKGESHVVGLRSIIKKRRMLTKVFAISVTLLLATTLRVGIVSVNALDCGDDKIRGVNIGAAVSS